MPANPDQSADEPTAVLVPVEPTAEMQIAAENAYWDSHMRGGHSTNCIKPIYRAMLAARPEAQAAPKLAREHIEQIAEAASDYDSWESSKADGEPVLPLEPWVVRALCDMALASLHAQAGVSEQQAEHSVSASQRARSPE